MQVSLEDIKKAQQLISPYIKHTQVDKSISCSQRLGCEVFYKFENEQFTGSFKLRGALNKIANLSDQEKSRGVVACSAGNHAQGVAFSATKFGVKSTIVMPTTAPLIKVEATKGYGARVILHGEIFDETMEKARELESKEGLCFVHPYEDPQIIAGQGTLGLEILDAIADLNSIVIPIGGGGLISGVATAIKALNPKCKVYGVQSSQAPGMYNLFHRKPLDSAPKRFATIADGIAIKKPSTTMYESFIAKLVDDVVTVTDAEISDAIVFLLERAKTVAEGSGAAGLAAVLHRKLDLGKRTCVLLCGGNIDLNLISKVIERGLMHKGRLAAVSVVVDDLPGNLNRLTRVLAEAQANVLEVHHERILSNLSLRETQISFVLETRSPEHVQEIRQALHQAGARVI